MESVAQDLDLSIRTVRRMIQDGKLTAYRVGKRLVRLDRDEVEALIASSRVEVTD